MGKHSAKYGIEGQASGNSFLSHLCTKGALLCGNSFFNSTIRLMTANGYILGRPDFILDLWEMTEFSWFARFSHL